MRWLILGVVLGVLLLYPHTVTAVAVIVAALLSKPLLVAFGLGVAAGVKTPRLRRRAVR